MNLVTLASKKQFSQTPFKTRALCLVGMALLSACTTQQGVEEGQSAAEIERHPDLMIAAWMDDLSVIPSTRRETSAVASYRELVPKAESGDADAQYELAQLYNFCWRIPSEDQAKKLIAKGMPASTARSLLKGRERCVGFGSAFLGWKYSTEPIDHWTLHALSNDQPMAIAEKSLNDYRDWQRQKVRFERAGEWLQPLRNPPSDEQIYLALARGTGSREVLGYAIRLGYRYFRVFNAEAYIASQGYDPVVGHRQRGPIFEAWSILSCHSLSVCSLESHLSEMRTRYSRNEMDENIQAALALYAAIEAHDWDALRLGG